MATGPNRSAGVASPQVKIPFFYFFLPFLCAFLSPGAAPCAVPLSQDGVSTIGAA